MRFIRLLSIVLAVATASAVNATDVVGLLPTGAITADLMTLAQSPRAQELTILFREAIARDPEWFKAFVAKVPGGQALPYDERFGISEREFEELRVLSTTQKLTKVQEVQITFRKRPDGSTIIEAPDLNDLDGVVISAGSDMVITTYGALGTKKPINNADASSATGAWSGTQWSAERIDSAMTNGYSAKLALGQLKADRRLILYFSAKALVDSNLSRRTDLILFFSGHR